MSAFLQTDDQGDHFLDVVGRFAYDIRMDDVQCVIILEKRFGVKIGDLPNRLACLVSHLLNLVLAFVTVPGEVSDIRDVHHMEQAICTARNVPPLCLANKTRTRMSSSATSATAHRSVP